MVRILLTVVFCQSILWAQQKKEVSPFQTKISGLQKFSGFVDFYWEEKEGKIWFEISRFDEEFLYMTSLPQGVGSNDIGLDRGQISNIRIVKFQRIGSKILLIQPNYDYRAMTDNPLEKQAVKESFAESVLWGFTLTAEENGKYLVDATSFLMNDAHDVSGSLKATKQGNYRVDAARSAVYMPRTKSFLDNAEFEVLLTFSGEAEGDWIRQVTPTPNSVTVHEHHSFIRLPDNKYQPRAFDPRSGYIWIEYKDFGTPIDQPLIKRYLTRHRLEKKNPLEASSEAIKPIVYYVDNGAPEPIRSALVEGASWWNQAFEAAGYKNAFQVKILPDSADPMDVRYNVIQWAHRATRGWSYGNPILDPRTGEIIKGHVTLGSQRVRQDYLIACGLLAPFEDGKPVSERMQQMALARIRQLSAHEIGHTIGLQHNFAASLSNRASVMDYPYPLVTVNDAGELDMSTAYGIGIGEWDKITIQYGYGQFSKAEEKKELNKVIQSALTKGIRYISDDDARAAGGAHPFAHLWDNGSDASDELLRLLKIRQKALDQFSEKNIPMGEPMATLEEALVPVYLFHRYQTEAVVKIVGGADYSFALRGDGQVIWEPVSGKEQTKALSVLLQTIRAQTLFLPDRIVRLIPPRPIGFGRHRELFSSRNGLVFDPLSAVESAADHAVGLLLHSQRASRLVEFHSRRAESPGLETIIDSLVSNTWKVNYKDGGLAEVQRTINHIALTHIMKLSVHEKASSGARAIAWAKLEELKSWIAGKIKSESDYAQKAFFELSLSQIQTFQGQPKDFKWKEIEKMPPGAPIGMDD